MLTTSFDAVGILFFLASLSFSASGITPRGLAMSGPKKPGAHPGWRWVVACSLLPNYSLLGSMSTAEGFCGNKLTNDRRSLSVSNSGAGGPLDVRSLLGINLQNVVEPPLQQISLLGL